MCKLVQNALAASRKLNFWEIFLFKIYIVAVTLIFTVWFPVLLSSSFTFYIILFVVLDIISISLLIKKEGNFLKKIFSGKKGYKIFQKFGVVDFGFFKLTLASFGLLIAKIFPVLLTLHLGYYIVIFGFGAGYFASILVKGNGK